MRAVRRLDINAAQDGEDDLDDDARGESAQNTCPGIHDGGPQGDVFYQDSDESNEPSVSEFQQMLACGHEEEEEAEDCRGYAGSKGPKESPLLAAGPQERP
eukprot:scaffold633_cov288-Ochromonas_danica.AAC.62